MIWVSGGGENPKMLIKASGFVVLGVNDNRADADDICGLECAQQGVFQKSGPDPFPLPIQINRKSC